MEAAYRHAGGWAAAASGRAVDEQWTARGSALDGHVRAVDVLSGQNAVLSAVNWVMH